MLHVQPILVGSAVFTNVACVALGVDTLFIEKDSVRAPRDEVTSVEVSEHIPMVTSDAASSLEGAGGSEAVPGTNKDAESFPRLSSVGG